MNKRNLMNKSVLFSFLIIFLIFFVGFIFFRIPLIPLCKFVASKISEVVWTNKNRVILCEYDSINKPFKLGKYWYKLGFFGHSQIQVSYVPKECDYEKEGNVFPPKSTRSHDYYSNDSAFIINCEGGHEDTLLLRH